MLTIVKKKFIEEMPPFASGTIVIDTDLQGAWEMGDNEMVKWSFPRAYEVYRKYCLGRLIQPGNCLLIEDGDNKIAMLITKRHRNDPKPMVLNYFQMAMKDFVRKIPCDEFIYSPILGRRDKCFDEMKILLNGICKETKSNPGYTWFVYTNGESNVDNK